MFQKFTAVNMSINNGDSSLLIEFSFDVDASTVNADTLFVADFETGNVLQTKTQINGQKVTIHIIEQCQPNHNYTLTIDCGLKSIVGERLAAMIRRKFSFKTTVDSNVKILCPKNYETISNDITLHLKETKNTRSLANNYKVIISEEPTFTNIICSTIFDKKKYTLSPNIYCTAKTLYIKARAQKSEEDFGDWSETVAISFTKERKIIEQSKIEVIKKLQALTIPESNITPKSFIFEFDGELDPDSIEGNIIILRKEV